MFLDVTARSLAVVASAGRNNGSLYPIKGKFVDDSVCAVVPKGSTWAVRLPLRRVRSNGRCGVEHVDGQWGPVDFCRYA